MPKPHLTQYLFVLSHATLFRNTRFITSMNPYAELNIGGNIRQTAIAQNAGTQPVWQQELKIKSYGGSLLRIQIKDKKDEDDVIDSETICEGIVDLKAYGLTCELEENLENQFHNVTVQLSYEGKKCGEVFMRVQEIKERNKNGENRYSEYEIQRSIHYGKQNHQYPNKEKIFPKIARDNILSGSHSARIRSHKENQPTYHTGSSNAGSSYYHIRSSRQVQGIKIQTKRSQDINIPLHLNGMPTLGFRQNQKASLRY